MRQLSKSTLLLVITLALFCALAWKLRDAQREQHNLMDRLLEARALAATASDSSRVVTIARPWVRLAGEPPESFFDFTDSEWQALTNVFADKLSPLVTEQLVFAEGAVTRVSTARLKELSASESVQTNAVWFLKP